MSDSARLLFVGDISLGGDYASRCKQGSLTWAEPFGEVHPVFQAADLRIGNLESPLCTASVPRQKKNLLGAPQESVVALTDLGFTVLNLGNNHITDQGAEGIARTREVLEANGIAPFGAGESLATANKPAVASANGLSFAFLGYAVPDRDVSAEAATDSREGCVPPSLERVEKDVGAVRGRVTHVVVSIHWGYQYSPLPDPEQISIAQRIIDLGALIVFGHHTHVVQGIQRHKNGLILYSLGNFFFPSFVRTDGVRFRFPKESRESVAVLCEVGGSGVRSFATTPLTTDRENRMHIVKGRAAARATRRLVSISRALAAADYASLWQKRHKRAQRVRRRQEEGLKARSEVEGLWRRFRALGVTGSMRKLNGHRVVDLVRWLRRVAAALHT